MIGKVVEVVPLFCGCFVGVVFHSLAYSLTRHFPTTLYCNCDCDCDCDCECECLNGICACGCAD